MRKASLVPTNLLDWPRVAPLLPEQKLILIALWASPFINSNGCGCVPPRPFSTTLGLSHESLKTGLKNLVSDGLLLLDESTDEVFILDWFRFHSFKTPAQIRNLNYDNEKVMNSTIKQSILEKTMTYVTTVTVTATVIDKSIKTFEAAPSGTTSAEKEKICLPEKNLSKAKSNSKAKIPPVSAHPPASLENAAKPTFKTDLQYACANTWDAYKHAMEKRYGVEIERDARSSSMIKSFVSGVGQEQAPQIIAFFVEMNDPFYVKNCHALNLLMRDYQGVKIKWTQSLSGKTNVGAVGRDTVREVLAGTHRNLHMKNYREGVDENGRLIF